MKIEKANQEYQVKVVGVNKQDWENLRNEIIAQDADESTMLELENENTINDLESEDIWAVYNPESETLVIYENTIKEYLLENFDLGEESTAHLRPFLSELEKAYNEYTK